MLKGRERRARPMDLGPAREPVEANLNTLPEVTWIEPVPDGLVSADGDPADVALAHETIRLAFVAALQHLPPRQRAVLILCEVLRWKASEVAELLDSSVASVNSALQRARATLDESEISDAEAAPALDESNRELLARYVEAFERYDMEALTSLIHEDATQSMPPFDLWLSGRDDILSWWVGPGGGCRGSRVIPTTSANGSPAFGQYKPSETGEGFDPWALQVLEISSGRIVEFTFFLGTETLFPLFGLPAAPRRVTSSLVRQDVGQAHEGDQLEHSLDAPLQPDLTAVSPSAELQPRERVDRHGVYADAADVAQRHPGTALLQQRADPFSQPRQIGTRDRALDREGDRVRCRAVIGKKTVQRSKTHRLGLQPRGGRHRESRRHALAAEPVRRPVESKLEGLAHAASEEVFAEGQRVLRQGMTGGGFYVILEGGASVEIDGTERARLARGDFFGEISILLDEPPAADVVATSVLRCLTIPDNELKEFMLKQPTVMYRMLQVEARRLRAANVWRE